MHGLPRSGVVVAVPATPYASAKAGQPQSGHYLARQRCQCWSHHKPLMMHRVYEAACSGGSACLEHESNGG